MFSENKLEGFSKEIADLPDRPQMSAQALKAYFDGSAEELRVKFNALIDALDAYGASAFAAVDYSAADGKLTFTFGNGDVQEIDLPLELLIESGYYNSDERCIVMVLANGDAFNIPVSDLVDEYEADEKTLHMTASETSRILSVKDGVFASEAPSDNKSYMRKDGAWTPYAAPEADEKTVTTDADGKFAVKDGVFVPEAPADGSLYARKDGGWASILEGLPHITLAEAKGIADGLYIVDDAAADWAVGTTENPLSYALLISGAESWGDNEGSVVHQMLILPCGELWWRVGTGEWKSVIPSLEGYAKTSDVDAAANNLVQDKKLKLLKTVTLEEDVASINVEFDKPLDEIAILFDVSFLVAENKAMAARTDGGGWYMFWAGGAMKTTNQFFFAHTKEYGERCWETHMSGAFFGGMQGISNSTTAQKIALSRRLYSPTRFVKDLNIFIPNNTSENAFAAGSTIQIWGHEADESI